MNTFQRNLALLILRITFGGLMLTHGIPKFMKLLEGDFSFSDPLGMGPVLSLILTVFAEFLCSIFIIVGWKSRLFAWPLVITMLVAAFIVHAGEPLADKEKALLFMGGFLSIALLGEGKYSIKNLF